MNAIVKGPSRRLALGLIGAALVSPRPVWAESLEVMTGRAFGTTWRVAVPAGSGLEALRSEIEAEFASIDRQMSPWRPDSAISLFNAGRAGEYATGPQTVFVTESALRIAGESGGAFDPTVGPLVARWGFGPISGAERPQWSGLHVGPTGIAKSYDGLTLDLCGIAKGHALDRAVQIAHSAGISDLLFDLGGEVRALGRHPEGRAWQVAVARERHGAERPAVLRLCSGEAVATSGLRMQSYTLGSRTYGHIIDPATRSPAAGSLHSVTVLSTTAMTADAWATALFASGDIAGPALARDRGISALFLMQEGPAVRQIATGRMRDSVL